MNFVVFVSLLSLAAVCVCTEMYSAKFDKIDLDEIFRSDRLLTNYHECFMERKTCTPQASSIRENLPDALKTECSKCTEKQKENAKKTLNFLFDEKPDLYKELEAKYDPEQIYRKKKEKLGKF
ncbi:ejaculatory bulb-specific protein 3-like isoform X2 [Harmonia axyridis]|uniref:ejaculatory bulb-specific protein 3-like isoform X2 n=1 Tax=Harmonia axyridis TaxID=115357 RepID=UPI001E275EFE|nr:ejaculatory bulb-specific protein 3-like isoform X2 [Harmonia axyridis]